MASDVIENTDSHITFVSSDKTPDKIKGRQLPLRSIIEDDDFRMKYTTMYASSFSSDDKAYNLFQNGLIGAVCSAYDNHHKLILRPDDFWNQIMMQVSVFIEIYSEELRYNFVQHEEKVNLTVEFGDISLEEIDYGQMCEKLLVEMKPYLNEDIIEWMTPDFTTTEEKDLVVVNMCILASMKQYFSYNVRGGCGIPEITLLGTLEDWMKLRKKIEHLLEYNVMNEWVSKMIPILDNIVLARQGVIDRQFWETMAMHTVGMSSPDFITGWIKVFIPYSKDKIYILNDEIVKNADIPKGFIEVPFKFELIYTTPHIIFDAAMIAGSWCHRDVNDHTIQPRSDWMILKKSTPEELEKNPTYLRVKSMMMYNPKYMESIKKNILG